MAEITRFQLNEIKREIWFQIHRIERDLEMSVRKPPGMLKSRRRLLLLLFILNQFSQDGILKLKEDTEVTEHADGTDASVGPEPTVRLDPEWSR
jgi:nitric oxide reductase activation protein